MQNQTFKMVREFHRAFGHPAPDSFEEPSFDFIKKRKGFTDEEAIELQDAIDAKSLVDVIDAWADILYFIEGNFVSAGINSLDVLAEVHRSNMSKMWPVEDEISNAAHLAKLGYERSDVSFKLVTLDDGASAYSVTRLSDGKVLKGPNFFQPNLAQFVKAETAQV